MWDIFGNGSGGESNSPPPAEPVEAAPAPIDDAASKEAMRAKRLGKLGAIPTAAAAADPVFATPKDDNDSPDHSGGVAKHARTSSPAVAPVTEKSLPAVPVSPSATASALPPTPPPAAPVAAVKGLSPMNTGVSEVGGSPSPSKRTPLTEEQKQERHARLMNSLMEHVFAFSVKKRPLAVGLSPGAIASTAQTHIEALDIDEDTSSYYNMITLSNISELVCIKLTSEPSAAHPIQSAVTYLYGCYKRLVLKEDSATSEQIRTDLIA